MRSLKLTEIMPLGTSYPRTLYYWTYNVILPVVFVALFVAFPAPMISDPMGIAMIEWDLPLIWLWQSLPPIILLIVACAIPRLVVWLQEDVDGPLEHRSKSSYWWCKLPGLLDMTQAGFVWRFEKNRPLAWLICFIELPWSLMGLILQPWRTARWFVQWMHPVRHESRSIVRLAILKALMTDAPYTENISVLEAFSRDLRAGTTEFTSRVINRSSS